MKINNAKIVKCPKAQMITEVSGGTGFEKTEVTDIRIANKIPGPRPAYHETINVPIRTGMVKLILIENDWRSTELPTITPKTSIDDPYRKNLDFKPPGIEHLRIALLRGSRSGGRT